MSLDALSPVVVRRCLVALPHWCTPSPPSCLCPAVAVPGRWQLRECAAKGMAEGVAAVLPQGEHRRRSAVILLTKRECIKAFKYCVSARGLWCILRAAYGSCPVPRPMHHAPCIARARRPVPCCGPNRPGRECSLTSRAPRIARVKAAAPKMQLCTACSGKLFGLRPPMGSPQYTCA